MVEGLRSRRAWLLGAGAALGALVAAGPAGAASTDRQTASLRFTTTRPGAPTGNVFSVDFHDPANPDAKPFSVATIVIRLHPGTVGDTTAPVQCKASDAELYAQGAAACPPESRVGGGKIVSDTGSSAGFPRFVDNVVDNFNNQDEVIGVADSTNVPVAPGFSRIVTRSPIRDGTVTNEFPAFPGNGGDGYAAIKTIRLSGPPVVRAGHAYSLTPPSCPSSGKWTNTLTFTYRDGVRQTVQSDSPCAPAGSTAPAARLALRLSGRRGRDGARRRCFAGAVRATVGGRDAYLARRAEFIGRSHARDLRPPLSRVIDRLRHRGPSHTHSARARVRMADGRLVRLFRRYRVCAQSKSR